MLIYVVYIQGAQKKTNKNRLTISTLNVNTLKTKEREEELNIALEDVLYDIIGLCEVRRLGEAIIEKDNGDIFCYKGETKGQRGVGFLIKNKLKI